MGAAMGSASVQSDGLADSIRSSGESISGAVGSVDGLAGSLREAGASAGETADMVTDAAD